MELVALGIVTLAWMWRERVAVLERREWNDERQILLDRIQAPEVVVARRAPNPGRQHVRFDDDADFHKATRENGEVE